MQLAIRIILSAALIVVDVAQASAAVATERQAQPIAGALSSSPSHAQRVIQKTETAWKRLSASICTGCGAPPQSSQAALLTSRDVLGTKPNTLKTAGTTTPVLTRVSARTWVKVADVQRARPHRASAQRHIRGHARLASIRRRPRYALRHPTRRNWRFAHARVRSVTQFQRATRPYRLGYAVGRENARFAALGSNWVSPRDRGYPLPRRSRQRHALCTYDRGFLSVLGLWPTVCVSSL